MIGTGVLVVAGPATAIAGGAVLGSLLLAGAVAACNATSAARLAARFPVSGGAYHWGRRLLHPAVGSLAGWCFVVGKAASAGAAALAVGLYGAPLLLAVLPDGLAAGLGGTAAVGQLLAGLAVVGCTAATVAGITRTAVASWWLVTVVVAVLGSVALAAITVADPPQPLVSTQPGVVGLAWPLAVPAAAGLFFLAFAGYARIATLGEEVRDPERAIPRAVAGAFVVAGLLYLLVTSAALLSFGVSDLARTETVVLELAVAVDPLLGPVAAVAGVAAALAVLLGVLAGVSRVLLAMGRTGELPGALAQLHLRSGSPWRADLLAGAVALLVVLVGGVSAAVAVSAVTVLTYYAVANAAALRLPGRRGRLVAGTGLAGCVGLAGGLVVAALQSPAAFLG